jgi:SsrA-binding protein
MAEGIKVIANNRQAYHDYHIEESLEAGVALLGTEVKSIREGRVNLRDSYVRISDGEAWLWNAHIAPYTHGNRENHEPTRARKLLLHRKEIGYLAGKVSAKGLTIVPLKLYLKHGRIKLEIGLARGKRQYDKREAIAEREARREIERAAKGSTARIRI